MTKPPRSTPHSDLDGVHEDQRPHARQAGKAERGAAPLEQARSQATARPPHSSDQPNPEDRST